MTDIPSLYNPDAEESLVGAVLIDPVWYEMSGVTSQDFYLERLRWVWDAVGELRKTNQAVDFVTVSDQLQKDNLFDEFGGNVYLTRLIGLVPSSTNAESYATIVKRDARRRRMLTTANSLASAAYHPENQDIDEAVEKAIGMLSNTDITKGAQQFSKYLTMAYEEADRRYRDPREVWGMSTGYIDWDNLTGGIHQGESTAISGPPGTGKSMVLFAVIENMASKGNPGAFYSIEMSGTSIALRGISAQAEIPTRKIKTGKMVDDDWSDFCHAVNKLSQLPIYICDDTISITQLRADLFRLKIEHDIKWFAVDYLSLLAGHDDVKEYEKLGILSRSLKLICRQLNLAGLMIDSMTKEGIDAKNTSMTGLRGGAPVLHDFDNILIAQVDDKDDQILSLTFEKLRDVARLKAGKPTVKLYRNRTFPKIRNLGTVKQT